MTKKKAKLNQPPPDYVITSSETIPMQMKAFLLSGSKKYPDHPGLIAEERLVPQLGTSPQYISENNEYDHRILSYLNATEVAWTTLAELIPDYAGGRLFRRLAYIYKMNKRSQGGWTSQNILKALGNLRGIPAPKEIARKPNILARNLWNRDWKEKAIEEGKEVVQE